MFDKLWLLNFLLREGAEENEDIEAVAVGGGLWYSCLTEESVGEMQQDGNYEDHHEAGQPGVGRETSTLNIVLERQHCSTETFQKS